MTEILEGDFDRLEGMKEFEQKCFKVRHFLTCQLECTGRVIALPRGVGIGGSISKILSFMLKFLCDGQGPVRQAILYMDRSFYQLTCLFLSFG